MRNPACRELSSLSVSSCQELIHESESKGLMVERNPGALRANCPISLRFSCFYFFCSCELCKIKEKHCFKTIKKPPKYRNLYKNTRRGTYKPTSLKSTSSKFTCIITYRRNILILYNRSETAPIFQIPQSFRE